jgi:hypothetical protein
MKAMYDEMIKAQHSLLTENQYNADPLPNAACSMMESHLILPADLSNTFHDLNLSKNQSELWLLD